MIHEGVASKGVEVMRSGEENRGGKEEQEYEGRMKEEEGEMVTRERTSHYWCTSHPSKLLVVLNCGKGQVSLWEPFGVAAVTNIFEG